MDAAQILGFTNDFNILSDVVFGRCYISPDPKMQGSFAKYKVFQKASACERKSLQCRHRALKEQSENLPCMLQSCVKNSNSAKHTLLFIQFIPANTKICNQVPLSPWPSVWWMVSLLAWDALKFGEAYFFHIESIPASTGFVMECWFVYDNQFS